MGRLRRRGSGRSLSRRPLWVMPALAVAVALALGAALSTVDLPTGSFLERTVFRGSASDARQLLATVTSTMITVTSLVFVLTVVALQIASTQFSPRLLRSFLRDRGTQVVLSTFVGTVAYSLAGLHTVGGRVADDAAFVPRLAVTGALALALVSVAMLVYYIGHITNSIRIDTIMNDVAALTLGVVRRTMPSGAPDPDALALPPRPADAVTLVAPRSGYVQAIVADALARRARDDDATVVLTVMVGYHVVAGRPVGWVHGARVRVARYAAAVDAALVVDRERKIELDVGFGLKQLADIAGRALSPSLNDPYSAVQAIHHASEVLVEIARRRSEPVRVYDGERLRVVATCMGFVIHLETVCDHVRWAMARRPNVALALLLLLEDVGSETTDDVRRAAVRREVGLVVEEAERVFLPADLPAIRDAASRAEQATVA